MVSSMCKIPLNSFAINGLNIKESLLIHGNKQHRDDQIQNQNTANTFDVLSPMRIAF